MTLLRQFMRRLAVLLAVVFLSAPLFAQPTSRTNSRMAFDASQGSIILFGGATPADSSKKRTELNDTWQWNGVRWVQRFPANSPSGRSAFVMVYDSLRERILIYGGTRGATALAETWAYKDGNWTNLEPASPPPARRLSAAAYDPDRDRIVLFGGLNTATFFDTWEFDGTAWSLRQSSGPELASPSMVYDEARDQMLLLGLTSAGATKMFHWTGSTWESLTPTTLPPCANQASMTYQTHNERVLFVGGGCSNGTTEDDDFEWDGTDWTKLEPSTSQGAVFGHALAYDRSREESIIFGGIDFVERNLTLRFRDNRWSVLTQSYNPGPRSLFLFESDRVNNVSWLVGGINERNSFSDLWRFTSGRWEKVQAPDAPLSCGYPTGTFDTGRGRLVVFCQSSAEVHEWDGTAWHHFTSLKDRPSERRFGSMAYDARLRKSVLFGGYDGEYLKETWTWDGQTWVKLDDKGAPFSRGLATLFYDPTLQKVVLFAGIGRRNRDSHVERFNDMWSFDGARWTVMTVPSAPSPRYGIQYSVNPVTNHLVMFGGKDENENYINEVWDWSGSAWTRLQPENVPAPRMNGSMLFDPTSGKFALYGGFAGGYFSELWMFDGARWAVVEESGRRRRGADPSLDSTPSWRPFEVPSTEY